MEKINILTVDDRPQNLLVLERYLKDSEINIVKAESGNQALGLVLERQFALILMDVQMPDMDGFETAELIRQNNDSKEIPIIFLTAISKEEKHVFKGYQSGAVDYLFKPFDPEILRSKVAVFVKLHKQKLELESINSELEKRVELRTAELRIAKEKAKQANIAKSRFLSNMSHELLTPLHGIMSFANLGATHSEKPNDSKLHKYFTNISESGYRLRSLLQDLLDLTQFQSGNFNYSPQNCCIEGIIDSVINNLSHLIQKNSITINIEKPAVDTIVWCDPEKMNKLFRHLISNAIKFSNQGGLIDVSFAESHIIINEEKTPALQISIRDQGVGIPDEELTTIFEKFQESSITESGAGGRGLGLAICWEITVAHHGKIWAENIENGSVLKVLLPYQLQSME